MCFKFISCFGSCGGQDYGRSASKATPPGDGGGGGGDTKSGTQPYHPQPTAADVTQRNAHDAGGARKDHVKVEDAGGHGGPAGNAQDKASYYSGADHKSGPQADHQHQRATDETPRHAKDGDGARKDHVKVDDAGGHGGHTGYAQDKADDEVSKHPQAWTGKVGDGAGHTYTTRLQEDAAAADLREHATPDHHHYPTTTTTTTKARY